MTKGAFVRWVIASSIRLAVVVLIVFGLILAGGVVLLGRAPVDTLPELLPPSVQVHTDAIGLSSGEVEQFLTVPAEYELANVAYLDSLRSRSVPGLSSISLTFKRDIDVWTARQLVAERMAQVPLPVDIGTPPVLVQPQSSSSRAMMVSLTSTSVAQIDLTTLAKWQIRPRLLAVPGVADVAIWGQKDREMLVLLDPARMSLRGVTIDQVTTTVGDSMWTSPLTFVAASSPGADGLIDLPNQRLTIQHILPIITSKDLLNVPIEGTGPPAVSVGDISTVIEDSSLLTSEAVLKRAPGLILVVEKLPGANELAVTSGVDAAMSELEPGLTGITVDTGVFRPGSFLADSLNAMGAAGAIAFIVMCVWLGLAYRSWRASLVAAVSIGAALLTACLVLYAVGEMFNVMVLAGLVMALGVIVDDAMVGITVLKRRRAVTGDREADAPEGAVATEAFLTGRRPLGFVLAALVLAAAPFFFIPDVAGTLSARMIGAYVVALVASAVVSATIAPALSFVLSPSGESGSGNDQGWLARLTRTRVDPAAKWPGLVALIVVLVVAASLAAALLSVPKAFVPSMRDGSLVIHWQGTSGTSLAEMQRVTASAEEPLRALAGVRSVTSHVGRALAGDQIVGSDAAETWIDLDPGADYDSTVLAVRNVLAGYPGLAHSVASYADDTIKGATADSRVGLRVRVYGENYDQLTSSADQVRAVVAAMPGIVGTRVTTTTAQPLIQIETDIAKAARFGLKPGDIRRQAAALVAGISVGSYYQDQQVFDVSVWGDPALRQNPGDIANLPIFAADGTRIPLSAVATVSMQPTRAVVDHDKASRYVDVIADVSGGNASSVVADVKRRMQSLPLPLGYHTEVSSPLAQRQGSVMTLALIALAAVIAVYLLLQAALQSWRSAALVMVLLPFAVSGGVLAAVVFGWGLSLGVVAGVVAVLGVALRNTTMLVRRFESEGDQPHGRGEIRVVASLTGEAALPVVMTAVATAVLVAPFVVLGNVSGIEVLKPFAVVVMFGLITSTLLTLLVLPAMYRRRGPGRPPVSDVEGAQ